VCKDLLGLGFSVVQLGEVAVAALGLICDILGGLERARVADLGVCPFSGSGSAR
jgi:hypothetical protein